MAIGIISLGYVWQKDQIYELAREKKRCEIQLDKLRRDNKLQRERLEYLRLPWVLDKRIKELNLGLGPPQQEQIVRLIEPPELPQPAQVSERQYVGN